MFFLLFPLLILRADEIDDVTRQLEVLKKDLALKEVDQQKVTTQLNEIKRKLTILENEIEKKEQEVKEGEEALAYQQTLLNERARSYYKNSTKEAFSLLTVLVAEDLSTSLRDFFYHKSLVDEDKRTIIKVVLYIKNLEEIKKNLESEKIRLAELKIEVDKQSQLLASQISQTRSKIVELTARQQQLIANRIAGLNLSRSAGSPIQCVDDRNLDPGFGSAFAFYTYGIPHRVGMSQYGAYGRASRGNQDYKTILNVYFQNMSIECRDIPSEIQVEGFGGRPFEDYIKGVVNREMGADIPEALKAQAVAARSYALTTTNNASNSICASENCQVYSDARRDVVNSAVDATGTNACGGGKAEVMASGGQPIKAWFASTFGGYAHTSGEVWGGETSWTKNFADTSSGVGSFSDLNSNAWDKESKCFYTAQGSRGEYGKSAWLLPSEVADIANTLLLVKKDSSTTDNLYQIDKPNPAGKENWNSDKVKSTLSNPFNNVTDVRITDVDFGSGKTKEIVIVEGGKEERFGGDEFKNRFNLRAPANISIVGPLYNVEKR